MKVSTEVMRAAGGGLREAPRKSTCWIPESSDQTVGMYKVPVVVLGIEISPE